MADVSLHEPDGASAARSLPVDAPYVTTDAVRDLVDAFEDCTLPWSAWTHAAHLTVAFWYVLWYGPDAALDRVRMAITRYNTAHGVVQTRERGYHETITRFYVWAVGRHLRDARLDRSLAEIANDTIAALADRELPLRYYSRELLGSWGARTGWVDPDLQPLH
jgi:hypothetical protein